MAKDFDLDKRNALTKADKSAKGDWDSRIIPLCNEINKKNDFYTSSSCSGRVVLLKIPKKFSKQDAEWSFVSHEKTSFSEMEPALKDLPDNQIVFRYEPFILHIVCRTLDDAEKILNLGRTLGFKRCGIISLKKITVEIAGTARISTLIADEGKLLLPEDYIKKIIETSNDLLEQNWQLVEMIRLAVKNRL